MVRVLVRRLLTASVVDHSERTCLITLCIDLLTVRKLHSTVMVHLVAALGLAMSLASCASMPIPGGHVVNRDYRPQVLVVYAADGELTPGVRYSLVQQGSGLAFFEQTGAGAGTVLESHWTDGAGDHFAIWASAVEPGDAVEVVVPLDRTQPAYRFVYPPGLYDVGNVNGFLHPIPRMLIEASTQLRPVGPGTGAAAPPQ